MEINNWVTAHIKDLKADEVYVQELGKTMVVYISAPSLTLFFQNYDQLNLFAETLFMKVKAKDPQIQDSQKAEVKVGDEDDGEIF